MPARITYSDEVYTKLGKKNIFELLFSSDVIEVREFYSNPKSYDTKYILRNIYIHTKYKRL